MGSVRARPTNVVLAAYRVENLRCPGGRRVNVDVAAVPGGTRKRTRKCVREKRGPKSDGGGGDGGGDARACFGGRVTNESRGGMPARARVANRSLPARAPTAAAETESGTSETGTAVTAVP